METIISEIAQRIKGLRELLEISEEEMAGVTDVKIEEYRDYENGINDFPFTFLMKCAMRFGIDIIELMTGENPRLSFYTIVRSGKGLPIERRSGFKYRHLAFHIKNKLSEPFLVTAPYSEEEQKKPIKYSVHEGQEFDYIISGSLKLDLDGHIEVLNEGDSIYYDSGHRHGMVAANGKDCDFLAIVIKKPEDRAGKEGQKHAGA
jgi:mannose-6-phosphate isomerase-like protein (cupin superfamily)